MASFALVVLGLIGALRAAFAGADFMYDLEQPRSALGRTPPVVVDPETPRLAHRVVVVIVDGLRFDTSHEMKYLNRLRAGGVDAIATSHYPTWSRPNYVSILTGVPPQASGVRTNRHPTPVVLDSLMDRARAAGLSTAVAADNSALPALFLRPPDPSQVDQIDIDAMLDPESDESQRAQAQDMELVSPFDDGRYTPWPDGVVDAGRAQLAGDHELQVLLIGAVDDAGHAEGADSPEYHAAAQVADRALARLLTKVDLSRDTIIVTADHGHTGPGGHGGVEREVLQVPLVAVGAGIRPGTQPVAARLIDIAPTVAALLALPAPGHGLGRTLTEILALDGDAAARRVRADNGRIRVTSGIVATSRRAAITGGLARRGLRLIAVAALGFVLVAAALGLRGLGGLRFDWRALGVGVPAFFVVYYTMIAALGQRFSPSFLPARGHIALELARYGLVGVVAHLIAGWLVLRRRKALADRLATANGNAAVGLVLTMVPAGLLWAFFPAPYVEVPGPRLLVLIPAVQVAVALYAIGILLALAVEIVVFFSRAIDPNVRLLRLERAVERTRKQITLDGTEHTPPPRL
jgi:hypothetical protein